MGVRVKHVRLAYWSDFTGQIVHNTLEVLILSNRVTSELLHRNDAPHSDPVKRMIDDTIDDGETEK